MGDGTRVSKTHPRIASYGGVDELNSVIGVVIAAEAPPELARLLRRIQNDLFDVGADLCVPQTDPPPAKPPLRVTAEQVTRLEGWIDAATHRLEPLTSFVLPGGTLTAAHLHHARTVARRSEIAVVGLSLQETVNPHVIQYLNRLSDLLFVLARLCNHGGADDILWVPGERRDDEADAFFQQ